MGILNLTPDSYFAESRCMGADGNIDLGQVLEKIRKMFADGAGIVDIGACSTRPGAELPDEDEEWRRLSVLMPVLRKEFPGRTFSVDTFRSGIVRKCFEAIGNFIVNDISAGEDDPKMLETVGKLGLTYVAMHKKGTPSDMQERCSYGDVTEDVLAYFRDFAVRADNAGITDWILDPGFGFAKTVEQNWQLMRELDRFSVQGRKVLVGISRKSMIYKARPWASPRKRPFLRPRPHIWPRWNAERISSESMMWPKLSALSGSTACCNKIHFSDFHRILLFLYDVQIKQQ